MKFELRPSTVLDECYEMLDETGDVLLYLGKDEVGALMTSLGGTEEGQEFLEDWAGGPT